MRRDRENGSQARVRAARSMEPALGGRGLRMRRALKWNEDRGMIGASVSKLRAGAELSRLPL